MRSGTATIAGQTFTASQQAPPAGLPTGWSNQDIGTVGLAGASRFDQPTGTFTMTGAGADVWGTADALQFAYTPLTGDGSIVARVASVQNTNAWTKAGVMIRGTVDPGSAQGFMLVSFSKGLAYQRRLTNSGSSISTAGPNGIAPYWVRLDRVGNLVTAYQSADGVAWSFVDSDTLGLPATILVGLGVSSHSTSATATCTFDHVTVTPGTPASPTPLPTGWEDADIGAFGIAGVAAFNASSLTFEVKGAGADIWNSADAFHFAYKPLDGDGVIVARVASLQNTNAWAKAGVMIRETLAPGAAEASMLVSAGKGLTFQRRTSTGGVTTNIAGAPVAAPYWVKLERVGSTFNAYSSADGTAWTLVGTDTIPMSATVFVGLGVSSHTTTAAALAVFDHVSP
jgi:regulation of enolase protein 1 (concanavalin A-like superfamily)